MIDNNETTIKKEKPTTDLPNQKYTEQQVVDTLVEANIQSYDNDVIGGDEFGDSGLL